MNQSRPKAKLSRALGIPLTPKCVKYFERRPYPPGVHGRSRRKESDYKVRLLEKQRLRHQYNVSESPAPARLRRGAPVVRQDRRAARRLAGDPARRAGAAGRLRPHDLPGAAGGGARPHRGRRRARSTGRRTRSGRDRRSTVRAEQPRKTPFQVAAAGAHELERPHRALPGDVRLRTAHDAGPRARARRDPGALRRAARGGVLLPSNRGGAALPRVRDNAHRDRTHRRPAVAGPHPGLHRSRRPAQTARLPARSPCTWASTRRRRACTSAA